MARISIEKNISYDDVRKIYYVTFNYGDGVRVKKTYNTKAEAQKAKKIFEGEKSKRELVKPNKETVESWFLYWLENICKPNTRETTVYGYSNIIIKHILPELGKIELQKLSAAHIRSYYAKKTNGERPLSNNTLRKHHDVFSIVLNSAVIEEKIEKNPIDKVIAPKKTQIEYTVYSAEELSKFFKSLEGHRLEVVAKLAGYYGLRREEICGLMWADIDFENNVFSINRAMTMAGGRVIIGDPKTESSKRKQALVNDVKNVLIRLKQEQDQNKEYLGAEYSDTGFVLTWPNGMPYRPNYISELFTKFLKDNNFKKIKLHELRHSFASIANDLGISLFDISKALGHGTPSTTGKVYTHLFDQTNKKTIDRVAEAILKFQQSDNS